MNSTFRPVLDIFLDKKRLITQGQEISDFEIVKTTLHSLIHKTLTSILPIREKELLETRVPFKNRTLIDVLIEQVLSSEKDIFREEALFDIKIEMGSHTISTIIDVVRNHWVGSASITAEQHQGCYRFRFTLMP